MICIMTASRVEQKGNSLHVTDAVVLLEIVTGVFFDIGLLHFLFKI